MSAVEKVMTGLVGVALVTTLVLPGRQTGSVLKVAFNGTQGLFSVAQGRAPVNQ